MPNPMCSHLTPEGSHLQEWSLDLNITHNACGCRFSTECTSLRRPRVGRLFGRHRGSHRDAAKQKKKIVK